MNREAIIFGYSGHAYVIIEMLLAKGFSITGYFDNDQKTTNPFNLSYLGTEQNESALEKFKDQDAFVCIGENKVRSKVFQKLISRRINCPVVSHLNSFISPAAMIGAGSVVMAGAVINAFATIGSAAICNSSSVIEHECTIGDYTHIAPGAVLAGNVTVGSNSFIGANAVVRQGIIIGDNVTVGAGAVVTKDIADGLIVYGNPARIKQQ